MCESFESKTVCAVQLPALQTLMQRFVQELLKQTDAMVFPKTDQTL